MPHYPKDEPLFSKIPLTALRSFEAAARAGSFKAAAEELAVTPAAISHQIKSLEAWLGSLLFERSASGVRLTDDGERLYAETHRSLLDISRSLERFRPLAEPVSLTLSTTPALAASWLIPMLGSFHRAYPQFDVRLETSNDLVDLLRDASVDLVIRATANTDPALFRIELMSEWFGAYAAPGFEVPLDPPRMELIDLSWKIPGSFTVNWQSWCAAAGHTQWLPGARFREYDDEHFALNAAIAGQGLVLASNVLVADSVARGLLAPYRPDIRLRGPRYIAACVPGRERQAPVKAFVAWLEGEVAASFAS